MPPVVELEVSAGEGGKSQKVEIPKGENLRKALLGKGLSPYRSTVAALSCRGMGVCGTCKVRIKRNDEWWERRSCQVKCFESLQIQLI